VRESEKVVGTPRLFGSRLGVLDERFGFALEELPGFLEQHAPPGQERPSAPSGNIEVR